MHTFWKSILFVLLLWAGACSEDSTSPGFGPEPVDPAPPVNPGYKGLDAYFGVNMFGGEFGGVYPGTIGTHYGYPTSRDLDYFAA